MIEFVVYRITNIRNNRVYIGSTGDFLARKIEHLGQLRTNKHCNLGLQRDFTEFKESSFVFEVIADGFRNRQTMLIKEYEIILKTKGYNYNVNTICPVPVMSTNKTRKKKPKYMRDPSCDKRPTTYYPNRTQK